MIKLKLEIKQEQSFFKKIKFVLVCLLLAYVGGVFLKLIQEFIAPNLILNIDKVNYQRSLFEKFILILLIAPILEELIFRLHLVFKKRYFVISILLLSSLLITELYKTRALSLVSSFYIIYIGYLFLIIFLVEKISIESNTYLVKTNIILNCMFFAFLHVTNYETINYDEIHIYIFNVLPMFIFGYFFSKIRLELNIYWAITAHMISNLLPFSILLWKSLS